MLLNNIKRVSENAFNKFKNIIGIKITENVNRLVGDIISMRQ